MMTGSPRQWIGWSACAALALLLLACGGSPSTPAPTSTTADLVLLGGTIHTMQPALPRAQAVAIRDGRVAAVGSDAEVRAFVGPRTRVVNLRGRSVTPGIVDGHCHLHGLGSSLESLSVRGVDSPAAAGQLVAAVTSQRAEGEWILGRGWDQNRWVPAVFPDHTVLTAAAPKHPVALFRIDGHALWANAAAMKAAGIRRDTPDPAGGKIYRDAQGEPTGVFVDNAMALVEAKIPPDPAPVRERRILRAAEVAVSLGLTGVHEMGIDDQTVAVYRALAKENRLPLRVYAYLAGEGQIDALRSRRPDVDTDGTAMFVLRGVKLFADGALGSRGASLLAPYDDDPANSGLSLMPAAELRRSAQVVAASGFQLAVHAIGDRANREVLDAFEAAGAGQKADQNADKNAGKPADLRFRVEHAQVLAPEDIPRFAKLGVIASMQPTHATSDMPWAEARVGAARIKGAYAWRSILTTGARITFGSDFPVEETSPLLGIYAAVTRQDPKGSPPGGWTAEQKLTLDEAIAAFTVEPAYASFVEAYRGRIAPGFVADLTVFDRALTPDRGLLETKVDIVILGGRVVRDSRAE
jgi:predicted amidohydrolase YtcJ